MSIDTLNESNVWNYSKNIMVKIIKYKHWLTSWNIRITPRGSWNTLKSYFILYVYVYDTLTMQINCMLLFTIDELVCNRVWWSFFCNINYDKLSLGKETKTTKYGKRNKANEKNFNQPNEMIEEVGGFRLGLRFDV